MKPLCIGIAGGSGSGKTYFARAISQQAGEDSVALLSLDQYFMAVPATADGRDVNFDHPAHLDFEQMIDDLKQIKLGKSIVAPSYDYRTMTAMPASVPIQDRPVVLVEGLFVLSKPMVDLFDITVFLDVDADQRLLGRILRDTRERGASIEDLVDRYQRFVRPSYDVFVAPTKHNADIVADFTYRRILLTKLMGLLLKSFVAGELDLSAFAAELRAECNHLGFTPREGSMPVSIDILKLARDYPEFVAAEPSMR